MHERIKMRRVEVLKRKDEKLDLALTRVESFFQLFNTVHDGAPYAETLDQLRVCRAALIVTDPATQKGIQIRRYACELVEQCAGRITEIAEILRHSQKCLTPGPQEKTSRWII